MDGKERKVDGSTLKAELYQAKEGTPYKNQGLGRAMEAGGPKRSDYKLVLSAWLDAGPDKDIPAQVAQAFQDRADTKRPMGRSDVLVLTTLATGTHAYYLDEGGTWRGVDLA